MSIPTYNNNLKKYAREHRSYSTLSETMLWNEGLKKRKLGYQFNRQRPIAGYIVDFFCKDLNLIIELDGVTHIDGFTEENKKERDILRQNKLEEKGYCVLRFEDFDIVSDFEGSMIIIKDWIKAYEVKIPM
jgi:very-short-patch-repair endonuclease